MHNIYATYYIDIYVITTQNILKIIKFGYSKIWKFVNLQIT